MLWPIRGYYFTEDESLNGGRNELFALARAAQNTIKRARFLDILLSIFFIFFHIITLYAHFPSIVYRLCILNLIMIYLTIIIRFYDEAEDSIHIH